jgi:hypothetical protein
MMVWLNKQSGQIVLATEQWEPLQVEHDEKFYEEILPEFRQFTKGRRVVKGRLIQVGWLIQNQHDVWFGVGMSAKNQFEELGEV